MKKIILSLLFLPVLALASADKSDFEYFKEIKNEHPYQLNYFDIDDDIESHSKKYLGDIRIFYKNREVPYKIIKEKDVFNKSEKKIILDRVSNNDRYYILDLNKKNQDDYVNNIFIESSSKGFRRIVNIWGSDLKNGPFEKINIERGRGDLVYDLPEGRDFSLDFKYSNYKYLKLEFLGEEGDFNTEGFYRIEKKIDTVYGEKDFLEVKGYNDVLTNNDQKIILDTKKDNLFFDQVKMKFSDKRFSRKYILYASDNEKAEILKSGNRFDKNKDYWVKISEGKLNKETYTGDPIIKLKNNKRFYRLDIFNGDNKMLDFSTAVFEKFKRKIYFQLDDDGRGLLKVYYSSDRVKMPNYDFVIDNKVGVGAMVTLGVEEKNKNFVKEKKSIFDNNKWLIYLMIGVIIFVLGFFVYKILKESGSKTNRDGMQI